MLICRCAYRVHTFALMIDLIYLNQFQLPLPDSFPSYLCFPFPLYLANKEPEAGWLSCVLLLLSAEELAASEAVTVIERASFYRNVV